MYFIILVFCLFYVQTLYILNQLVAKKYTHVSYFVVFVLIMVDFAIIIQGYFKSIGCYGAIMPPCQNRNLRLYE